MLYRISLHTLKQRVSGVYFAGISRAAREPVRTVVQSVYVFTNMGRNCREHSHSKLRIDCLINFVHEISHEVSELHVSGILYLGCFLVSLMLPGSPAVRT